MADDITDVYIATEAGDSGWQSLSALAAEQVEAKLPIESDDGTVTLDSPSANTFTVSTGGEERVKVQDDGKVGICSSSKGMGTITGGLKVGTDSSIGLQNVVYGKNANSYGFFVGVNLDMPSATEFVAYQSQQPQNYAGPDASVSKYVDFKSADATEFAKEQYGFYSAVGLRNDTDGSPLKRFQFYASTTAPSYFGGDIQTSRIVGATAPDNDASVALGVSAIITVNGSGVFQVSNSGNNRALYLSPSGELGIGRTPSAGIALDVYQPTSGARFQSTSDDVNSRIIFQEGSLVNEQFSFDRYGTNFLGGTTGSVVPKSAVIRNEADAALVITTGGSNTSDENAIQLRPGASNVNVNGYALKANSDKTVEIPGEIQTPKIVGATDPASDASIQLGTELLTTNHTPTQPNSIATKKYTDDADVVLQNNINQKAEIWVGTQAEYLALGIYNNQTLYCITD